MIRPCLLLKIAQNAQCDNVVIDKDHVVFIYDVVVVVFLIFQFKMAIGVRLRDFVGFVEFCVMLTHEINA